MRCWHRAYLTACRHCRTVDYLIRLVEADRARLARRNLATVLAAVTDVGTAASASPSSSVGAAPHLPDGPCRQRPRPEPTSSGSPDSPVRVLDLTVEADVATSP